MSTGELRDGSLDELVWDRSVQKRLNASSAADPAGSAVVTIRTACAGRLAVIHAVNDLAAKGIRPDTVRCSILLPPGTSEQFLRSMVDDIGCTAAEDGVTITGCRVEVTSAAVRPIILAEAEGMRGYEGLFSDRNDGSGKIWPEDAVLVLGDIGREGTFLLARERREELSARFPARFLHQAAETGGDLHVLPAVEAMRQTGIHPKYMINVSEGGIYAALWQLSKKTGLGFEVSLPDIPIRQETVEITDFYEINPYQMASSGCLLAVLDPADEAQGSTIGRIIGHLVKGNDRILVNGDERQCLNRPAADALRKVLG